MQTSDFLIIEVCNLRVSSVRRVQKGCFGDRASTLNFERALKESAAEVSAASHAEMLSFRASRSCGDGFPGLIYPPMRSVKATRVFMAVVTVSVDRLCRSKVSLLHLDRKLPNSVCKVLVFASRSARRSEKSSEVVDCTSCPYRHPSWAGGGASCPYRDIVDKDSG
ncbi:hypothetical protein K461DRAFT_86468 [Myriangium duriaei CBS 260.36]|uniref:Uncharacterized protein n=1 Tax=Myriangium duriaei CBS 260.36 TaxID=1168546 RepID=A0A9P4JA94_9PEZI|nr:hypothetical protein K461DRAFT_86468 [Myriangium duriaei CBS 260.36]